MESLHTLYAAPRDVRAIDDCYRYHTTDIPGHGRVEGEWDLTRDTASYLGGTNFRGARVLEVGPASGYLSFWMERAGAEVVSVDVADDFVFDVVPFAGADRRALSDGFVSAQRQVQNAYWFTHSALRSRNRVHYGSGYRIPAELGRFDIGLLASVLLHNVNPVAMIDQVAQRVQRRLIVADLCHDEMPGCALPTIQFYPSVGNGVWHTWWRFSEPFFVAVLKVLGFQIVTASRSVQHYRGVPYTILTVVGER